MCTQLLEGLEMTLIIFFLVVIFSLPLGLIVCFGRRSKFKPLSWIVRVFIDILRGTPLMLQLLVVMYGPYFLFGMRLNPTWRFTALIIGFVINYSAYFAEIYRAGIDSIPIGQYEAAEVLGYTNGQTFMKIILPQMVKRVIPPTTNEIITLVKDTSMAFVLATTPPEMFTLAKQITAAGKMGRGVQSMLPLFIAGVFYFVLNAIVSWAMGKLEKKLAYYQ
ncbi:MAG: amino acid ABC transporter permease [Oscillospiraceae bacterium]|nr:amino acid ABC transporter permease [Oscillospiraceae bacterium]